MRVAVVFGMVMALSIAQSNWCSQHQQILKKSCHIRSADDCKNTKYPKFTNYNSTGGICGYCAACEKLVPVGQDCRDEYRNIGYYTKCVNSTCNRDTYKCVA
ncbi:hypothetical protein L9F63_010914 [Diploptera punctata]|uniref:Uncharacterized protein n=1 Tax=Diploptera punctata TaxID=6984 RepID=A0AAD8EQU0_DIPPU|nr:hypothetical protein L9F63_010914 [Diploptera punctata]